MIELILSEDFDSDKNKFFTNLKTPPSSTFDIVDSEFGKSGAFEINFVSEEADNYRSETQLYDFLNRMYFGNEYWIGFRFKPVNWDYDTSLDFICQMHLRPGSWSPECNVGNAVGTNSFWIGTRSDKLLFTTFGAVQHLEVDLKKKWYQFVCRFKPSFNDDGLIEAWLDGNKIASVKGRTQMQFDACGNPMKEPYLNLGIYKWDWREGRKATLSNKRTIWYSTVRIAKGEDGYKLVSSNQATAPDIVVDKDVVEDTTPPTISKLVIDPAETSCVISWETNEPADSLITYSEDASYSNSVNDDAYVINHSLTLPNLSPGTDYNIHVKSRDASRNVGRSPRLTFTTKFSNTIRDLSYANGIISWKSDKPDIWTVSYKPKCFHGNPAILTTKENNVTVTVLKLTDYECTISGKNISESFEFTS